MYSEYMLEHLRELRHKVTFAFLIVILGMICLMGGMTMTILFSNHLSWLLIFPYATSASASLGLVLSLFGFSMISIGFVLAFYYDREKTWFLNKSRESHAVVDSILERNKAKKSS